MSFPKKNYRDRKIKKSKNGPNPIFQTFLDCIRNTQKAKHVWFGLLNLFFKKNLQIINLKVVPKNNMETFM